MSRSRRGELDAYNGIVNAKARAKIYNAHMVSIRKAQEQRKRFDEQHTSRVKLFLSLLASVGAAGLIAYFMGVM